MDETVKKLRSAYDAVAYVTGTYYQSHPDRLAIAAALRGITAPNVESCRVLEVGCATGSNLIPMAEQLPKSRFLGIDLSERQIESGSKIIRELQLTNIELRCQDIMDFPEDAGKFDYIIAHGVYSWVPDVVKEKLLSLCRAHLAPRGMAFISYNAYPGWRQNEMVREMMLYRGRGAVDPAEFMAKGRQIVQFVGENTPNTSYFHDFIKEQLAQISKASDRYLLHDHVALVNDPQYFWQFVEAAKAHGLAYVGDSGAESNPWIMISESARETISQLSADPMEREQYLDFLINRSFRNSVLCLAEAEPASGSPASSHVRDVYVSGNAPDVPAGTDPRGRPIFKFGSGDHQIAISNPSAIAALRHLRRAWPSALPFSELLTAYVNQGGAEPGANKAAEALERLIEMCHGCGIVELWSQPGSILSPTAGEFPRVAGYARWQAANKLKVTSLRHSPVTLDDLALHLVPLLDGTRNRKMLAAEIVRQSQAGTGPAWPYKNAEEFENLIDSALKFLAGSRLIMKDTQDQ